MKLKGFIKGFFAVAGSALLGLSIATVARAANPEPAVVQVEWIGPVTITKVDDLRFGLLDVAMAASETVTIAPDGTETDANNNFVGGTRGAASFTTTAVPSKNITIQVVNVSNGTYYTLGSFVCDYNNGTDGDCSAGYTESSVSGNIVVRVGATLTAVGGAAAGGDNGGFDLQITYQ
jgi:hypothetical protein